ncbi:hypothetical protein [Zhengella mangrovi]|nr:hypothetical protein [Zhengella mangrovi]
MPKLAGNEKGGWIAAHGKYGHNADGTYSINGGHYKGYTARYTGKDGVFDMFKDGHQMGQWTSPTKTDKIASPVALDLNGDGRISTTGASTARDRADPNAIGQTIAFDLNGDGVKEQVEWMNGGDGLVVDTSMIGADGSIDGRALMGDQGGQFTDGYAKMAGYDQNGDGQLTGQELGNLGVWVDNGNGIVEQGEIRSLADVGVNSLSTQRNDVVNTNGETLMRSTADVNGQQMMTEDVWFRQA